ncbi:MAG TPA: serine/threonine-protein kinase [Polyangiaceae bacterium]|nr:serine/threonine-protein kinase [Polyangiaceae bacterium]
MSAPRLIDGKFVLRRRLGAGSGGEVWEAENVVVGKRVALKLLHAALAKDGDTQARFTAEARAGALISHPNVIDIYDLGVDDDGTTYFVMELLAGESLATMLESRGAIPIPYAIELMLQILAALAAAHERGIIHRDLKPQNVIISHPRPDRPHVKVLDFGIAAGLFGADFAAETRPLGTPLYTAPEQAVGREVDARADVYAAGAVLYEMLVGHPPFGGSDTFTVLANVMTMPLVPPHERNRQIPVQLSEVICRAMSREPETRTASAKALATELVNAGSSGAHTLPPDMAPSLDPIPLVSPGSRRKGPTNT